ncbi:MAG: ATPase [Rhodobacteraceae bacterium]|nr:ATPase [Paracoccaceae bacterium]
MSYLIGVDGGGTGCRVAVADQQGRILARATGGAANIASDLATARKNILATTYAALESAALPPEAIRSARAVLGLAGANLGDFRAQLHAALPYKHADIISDCETTLTGAIGAGHGCIAAIGTGSVFGRRGEAGFTQLGGWGFLLGDDGAGALLGQDILRRTLLAHEKIIPHSPLTEQIMDEFAGAPKQIAEQARTFSPGDFGRFAPRVVAAATAGDQNAEDIMARHTDIVRKCIDAVGFDPEKAFCILGGLGPAYLARLPRRYRDAATPPLGDALDGAIYLAKRQQE